ncbi:MAG: leucine-rich repeat domain-containing protein, partial [Muribaculaceae bacterium]|nr:leucine-rich repeat domain-containing protein [Muribaculaceae bacterium]
MNRLSLWCLTALTTLGVAYGKAAEVSEKFVIVHCESPGTLTLSEDALIAPHLKVTGNIDQRDFEALKYATINVTRILDLTETVIHEYTSGNSDTRMDWIIDDPKKITYPADMLPAGAFSELRDNSISKFTRGSSTLKKLILPASLKGFMKGAFTSYSIITDLVVPEGSTTLRQDGKLVYSYDGSTLLAMPPAWFGDVTVASSVTSVADGAFDAAIPASVTFTSATPPTLSEGATLSTAYIIAPTPEAYSKTFPDIDCISELETVTLTNLQPGELMGTLGNMGYTRKDVRGIKISGSLSPDDFNALVELPNLHAADLSEAKVECESFSTRFTIANSSIADFKFPKFSKSMILVIDAASSLHGDLEVPDRTDVIYNYSKRFRSVTFPSTLYNLGERSFPEYNVTETLDFSQCSNMKELYLSYATQCLTTLRLPENIESIKYIDGPVKEVNLPGSLKELYGDYWMVEKLVLPQSLETFGMWNLPMVKEIDATEARSLYNFNSLSHAPNLKTLDISMCPIRTIKSLFGASSYSGSVVVSGGTRYPSISI